MAKLDDLIAQINDPKLRIQLETAAVELRKRKKFGLVYEQHIPETTVLPAAGVRKGSVVMIRTEPANKIRYVVDSLTGSKATITSADEAWMIPLSDLLVVKPFGEPVYPVLRLTETVVRSETKPFHVVLNGENFHALQMLLFGYRGQVDVIYIDPPYNVGARDWTYNNDFVDLNDSWRHSKWLSMMEKRLRLAKQLLAPNGVLVVTIDEHEVAHLGVLLEELFPETRRQMVTIVNNAAGVSQGGFYRVEEYAYFCFAGSARPGPIADDLLSDESKAQKTPLWFGMIRYGGINALPSKRPGLVYPIAVDAKRCRIIATGPTLKDRHDAGEITGTLKELDDWRPIAGETIDGNPVVWPYRGDGSISTWQLSPATLLALANEGFVRVRPQSNGPGGNQYSISYVKSANRAKIRSGEIPNLGREENHGPYITGDVKSDVIPKTVWKRARHDAGKWGSRTLRELLGSVSFDYAKSPYAVLDTLRTLVGSNPDALVLDFFAGSGTTLHSVAMLNAEDDGRRRCILVTNNQVDEPMARRLNSEGHYVGDKAFEDKGICRAVTIPRVKAALTGRRGTTPIEGEYQNGRRIAEGFEENAAFFDLEYADPDSIEIGAGLGDVAPVLWLASGTIGQPNQLKEEAHWLMPGGSPFAVLLDEDHFRTFRTTLSKRPEITHVWLVTDSEAAYARMRAQIADRAFIGMLYRDYLRNFRVNVDGSGLGDSQ